jgi:hypothetical protein
LYNNFKNKILGNKLIKRIKSLVTKNYKSSLKTLKRLMLMESCPVFGLKDNVNMAIFHKSIYRSDEIPKNSQLAFLQKLTS